MKLGALLSKNMQHFLHNFKHAPMALNKLFATLEHLVLDRAPVSRHTSLCYDLQAARITIVQPLARPEQLDKALPRASDHMLQLYAIQHKVTRQPLSDGTKSIAILAIELFASVILVT